MSFRYTSAVDNDNSIRKEGLVPGVLPGPARRSYVKAKIEVQQRLNQFWRAHYQDEIIAEHSSTELRDLAKALGRRRRIKAVSYYDWLSLALTPQGQGPSNQMHFDERTSISHLSI
jgi:hypothetical protein